MSFINHMLKKHKQSVIAISGGILILLIYIISFTFAAPPGSPYNEAETLDPSCSPGDPNCSVQDQWNNSGNDIYNTNTGNVGIGTASPTNALHVVGSIYATTQLATPRVINPTNGNIGLYLNSTGLVATSDAGSTVLRAESGNIPVLFDANDSAGGGVRFQVNRDGNVGIGTATPSGLFNVEGSNGTNFVLSDTSGNVNLQYTTDSGGFGQEDLLISPGYAELAISGETQGIFIQNSGGNNFVKVQSPPLYFTADVNTGFFSLMGGNVGIGTDAPATLLDVPGTATIGASNFDTTTGIFDGANRQIKYSPTVIAMDFASFLLYDTQGVQKVSHDFGARLLKDAAESTAIDYSQTFVQIHGTNSIADLFGTNGNDLRIGTDGDGTAGKGIYLKAFNGTDFRTGLTYLNVASGEPDLLLVPDGFGNVGINTATPGSKLSVVGLIEYTDNADAVANGLVVGDFYRTGDLLKVVH